MSDKLPRILAKDLIKIVEKFDFIIFLRQEWSHRRYKNINTWNPFTIPLHSWNFIHPKILKDVIKKLEITVENFKNLK